MCQLLGNDEPFTSFWNIYIVGCFYSMRMTIIIINGPINGALINRVHLWTLNSVDNAPSFFKGTHKLLLGMLHCNRTLIINVNGKSISVKVILMSLATGVGCTNHAIDVR